jgi:DNA-binding transcriptional regulator/RsmH inhibitor MraZ
MIPNRKAEHVQQGGGTRRRFLAMLAKSSALATCPMLLSKVDLRKPTPAAEVNRPLDTLKQPDQHPDIFTLIHCFCLTNSGSEPTFLFDSSSFSVHSTLYSGCHRRKVAPNGIALPPNWRMKQRKKEYFVLMRRRDEPALDLYPLKSNVSIEQLLANLNRVPKPWRYDARKCLLHEMEIVTSEGGRLLLSKPALDHAQIAERAELVGMMINFEIWESNNLATHLKQIAKESEQFWNELNSTA